MRNFAETNMWVLKKSHILGYSLYNRACFCRERLTWYVIPEKQ